MEAETLWERIKQGLLDGASTAAQKAEYLGRVGRARLDLAEARHAIRDALSELGGAAYAHLQADAEMAVGQQEDVQALLDKIRSLEAALKEREAKLDSVKPAGAQLDPTAEDEAGSPGS